VKQRKSRPCFSTLVLREWSKENNLGSNTNISEVMEFISRRGRENVTLNIGEE